MKRFRFLLIAVAIWSSIGAGCTQTDVQAVAPVPIVQPAVAPQVVQTVPTAEVKEEADVVAPIAQPINQQQEIEVKKAPEPAKQAIPSTAPNGTYVNVDGNNVPRPYAAPSAPAGASARCRDGTYSFSQHRSGTCSHHGGVAVWF